MCLVDEAAQCGSGGQCCSAVCRVDYAATAPVSLPFESEVAARMIWPGRASGLSFNRGPFKFTQLRISHYEYPRLKLKVECGSGTYIRSLGRDIGMRLKCGAVMSTLRRTRIGCFSIENSVTPEQIDSTEAVGRHLLPMIVRRRSAKISCHARRL